MQATGAAVVGCGVEAEGGPISRRRRERSKSDSSLAALSPTLIGTVDVDAEGAGPASEFFPGVGRFGNAGPGPRGSVSGRRARALDADELSALVRRTFCGAVPVLCLRVMRAWFVARPGPAATTADLSVPASPPLRCGAAFECCFFFFF